MLVEVLDFKGIQEIKDNIEFYKNKFLTNAVFCLRNANLTVKEQEEVARIFGDYLNWFPNNKNLSQDLYVEDHKRHMENTIVLENKESLMLPWHMEHVFRKNSVVSGLWNMEIFTCSSDAGKTYFVDMSKMFNELNNDYKEFLLNVEIIYKTGPDEMVFDIVQKHRITKENVIRFPFKLFGDFQLFKFKKENFDQKTLTEYEKIHDFIYDKVKNDKSIRLEQEWQKGDLVVVDLFKMAHAVSGGFTEGQRKFTGIFGAERPWGEQ